MENNTNNNNQEEVTKVKPSQQNGLPTHIPEEEEVEAIAPPDGGWGWVVVFCSFMIHVIADGVTYTIGIFYVEFLKYFHSSKGATAWVASILVGVTFCTGPIASALTNKYGCRKVAILGSIIASFGLAISTLAPNIIFLFFSIGLCTGVGFGLMYLPAIVSVTCYFEKKRAFATGIAVCGSGFGTFALAPLTEIMVEKYGWQGAMLLVSGLVLNCTVFGALFRPLEPSPKKNFNANQSSVNTATESLISIPHSYPRKDSVTMSEVNFANGNCTPDKNQLVSSWTKRTRSQSDAAFSLPLLQKKKSSESNSVFSIPTAHHAVVVSTDEHAVENHASNGLIYRKDIFYSGSLMNIPEYRSNPALYTASVVSLPKVKSREWRIVRFFRCSKEVRDVFQQMMDMSLLRNSVFLMFALSNFFTNIGFNVPFVYTKDRAMDTGIAEDKNASFLLAIIGISNTIGRVILGYLSDKPWINRLYLYNVSLTLCGLATAFSAFCKTYPLMATYSAVFGITAGSYVSLTSVILVDLLGLDKLTNAFGLLLVFEGAACLVGPPITGWLYDFTGTYDPGFYVCGVMIALSGIMLFAIPCMNKKRTRKEKPAVYINDEKMPI